jgi:hypothetical protein
MAKLPLAKWRRLVFALESRAKIRAMNGDAKGALEDVTACYRFGSDVRKGMLLTEHLVGVAIQGLAIVTAFQVLDKTKLDAALLQSFQNRMTELSKGSSAPPTMAGEKLLALDAIQSVCGTATGPTNRQIDDVAAAMLAAQVATLTGERLTPEQVQANLSKSTSEELTQLVEKNYAYYDSIIAKTPFQWKREGIDAPFQKRNEEMGQANLVLSLLSPSVGRISQMTARSSVHADALVTVLGLLRYKSDKGGLPADLKALLATGYIPALPMDPFGDGPLIYKIAGSRFTLYSQGIDLDDDNGKHAEDWGEAGQDGDYVFWPVQPIKSR